MNGYDEVYWHDCEILSAIEIPSNDQLIINVQYPVNWEENQFRPKAIVFIGFCSSEINEMPFHGNPSILSASIEGKDSVYSIIKLETNAGYRIIKAKAVTLTNEIKNV